MHSFLLAVDPGDPTYEGFLGGSVLGREFWRGLRGGGDAGAKTFKLHCLKARESTNNNGSSSSSAVLAVTTASGSKRGPANSLKTEVYALARAALRYLHYLVAMAFDCKLR